MEKEFTEKMKEILVQMKKDVLAQLTSNSSELQQIIEKMEAKDSIDFASDAVDGKTLEALGEKNFNKIKLIDAALSRIEQGKYGICVKCGKKIPHERLEAIPYALMCIECKSEDERRKS